MKVLVSQIVQNISEILLVQYICAALKDITYLKYKQCKIGDRFK